jgi:hypothetical protein
VLTLHHVAFDGWSWPILRAELALAYRAARRAEPLPLLPLPVQYADYARWQRQCLPPSVLEQQLAYWQDQLRGLSPLQLPTDFARPRQLSHRGQSRYRPCPPP